MAARSTTAACDAPPGRGVAREAAVSRRLERAGQPPDRVALQPGVRGPWICPRSSIREQHISTSTRCGCRSSNCRPRNLPAWVVRLRSGSTCSPVSRTSAIERVVPAAAAMREVISLPVFPRADRDQQDQVVDRAAAADEIITAMRASGGVVSRGTCIAGRAGTVGIGTEFSPGMPRCAHGRAGPFGSGTPDGWENLAKVTTDVDTVARVVAADLTAAATLASLPTGPGRVVRRQPHDRRSLAPRAGPDGSWTEFEHRPPGWPTRPSARLDP